MPYGPYPFPNRYRDDGIRLVLTLPGAFGEDGFIVTVRPASSGARTPLESATPNVAAVAGRIGADPAASPWRPFLAEYLADLGLKQDCSEHIRNQRETVERAANVCGWSTIADFRTDTTREWLLALQKAGRKPKTLRLYRDSMDRFGAWLVKRGALARNPVEPIPKARVVPTQARVVPTDDEVSRLIAGVYGRKQAGDRWLVYLTGASTGLRWGTIKALEWSMVDLDAARLTIPAAILKNRQPMTVHLTDELVTALRWHRAKGDGPRVFRFMPKPEQVTKDALRAGIRIREGGATFSYHSLRHYFSNRLMRSGASLEERKLAVGHLNGGVTLQTYTSPDLVRVGERVKALPSLLTGERFCQQPRNLVDRRAVLDDTHLAVRNARENQMVATLNNTTPDPTAGRTIALAAISEQHPAVGPAAVPQRVAQLGSAAGLGPAGRGFKSPHADSVTSPVSGGADPARPQVQIHPPGSDAAALADLLDAQSAQLAALARLLRGGAA